MAPESEVPSSEHQSNSRILRLTQIYKALSEINQAIVRLEDSEALLPLVCRTAIEYGGATMAWIGQHESLTDRIAPVECYGEHTDYLHQLFISAREDLPEGRGPCATAFRQNRAVVINNFTADPMTAPWHEHARRFGWGSIGCFPIHRGDKPFAVLSVYHHSNDFFDEETTDLLSKLARDVSYAYDNEDIERDRRKALAALQTSEAHFRAYFERSMVGMAATRPDQKWMEVNDALCQMLGYSRDELIDLNWSDLTHPDDVPANQELIARMLAGELDEYALEKRFIHKNGHSVNVHLAVRAMRDIQGNLAYVVALAEDITARKQAELRDSLHSSILEMIARGAPLQSVLDSVVNTIETANQDMMCSILLMDADGERIFTGSAPSLPDFYNEAINGQKIGVGIGSCGTAAATGKRVIVEDIATHPFWKDFRAVALQANLASAWSEPVLAADGKVLGTFAIYHSKPMAPDGYQLALIENAAKLVGIAIERRQAEEERHLAALIYQSSSEATMVTDAQNRIIAINPAFTRITGYEFADIRGQSPAILRSNRHDISFYQAMWASIHETGLWQGEVWNRRKNGEVFPTWLTINTIRDEHNQVQRYVALASDITTKVRSNELIWRQANFDFLTNLPNRYMFQDRLEQEIYKSRRESLQLALLFIDLDRFKDINDSLGHHVGDQLLVAAAKRIERCIRASDSVARLGGDEFTVILNQLGEPLDAERVAQNIITELAEPFSIQGEMIYISASVGITFYPDDSTDVNQLLYNADKAMYAAKLAGRNRLNYFTPSLHESAQKRLTMIHDLRLALDAGEFEVYFQPIVNLTTHEVRKAESLLRWHHPLKGMIAPNDFIPLAEETGLIVGIGDWVLRESVRWATHWSKAGLADLKISVNMSPIQFQSDALIIDDWLTYMSSLGMPAQRLNVEITEGLLLDALPAVTDKLLRFRDAGIQVSIDDFGTGYSALSYLKRFDIDYLKIDQSFIANLDSDQNNLALCEAIVMMAHKLGLKVIAEGVETDAQRQALVSIGCDFGQGYLFSRPLPAEAFEHYLTTRSIPFA